MEDFRCTDKSFQEKKKSKNKIKSIGLKYFLMTVLDILQKRRAMNDFFYCRGQLLLSFPLDLYVFTHPLGSKPKNSALEQYSHGYL